MATDPLPSQSIVCDSCGVDWTDFAWDMGFDPEPPCFCDLGPETERERIEAIHIPPESTYGF